MSDSGRKNSDSSPPAYLLYLVKVYKFVSKLFGLSLSTKNWDSSPPAYLLCLVKCWNIGGQQKVKSVDERLQVSDKTMAALLAAERKINDTGSAEKSSRYVTAGTAWFNGAFSRVAKAGQFAGTKTKQKFNMAMSNLTAKEMVALDDASVT